MICEKCGAGVRDNTRFCTSCGAYIEPPAPPARHYVLKYSDSYKGFPMKWHNFLIRFALWAAAALSVYVAFRLLEKSVVYGVAFFGMAALQVVTAVCLILRKRSGPRLLAAGYIANLVWEIIYIVDIYVGRIRPVLLSFIAGLLISFILIFANNAYYEKRKSVFVDNALK